VREYKDIFDSWETGVEHGGGWLGNYISNHDQPRPVSRFGDDKKYRRESAKALAMINMTMYGTPFMYQGEEIGMTNCPLEPEEWKDFEAINDYEMLQSMMHLPAPIAKKVIQKMTRDHARTPMQWSAGKNAGFTDGEETWMKINPNYTEINVEDDLKNPASVIDFYKQLIRLRHLNDELNYGSYRMIAKSNRQIIAYLREYEGRRLLIVVNMTGRPASVDIGELEYRKGHIILGTHGSEKFSRFLTMQPYEGRVYRVGEQ
jgi:oligo-1,6-glucosidase